MINNIDQPPSNLATSLVKPAERQRGASRSKFLAKKIDQSKIENEQNINVAQVKNVSAMLFLQEIEGLDERFENLSMLAFENLRKLQLSLLDNEISPQNFSILRITLDLIRNGQNFRDEKLNILATEIALRLEVEIAKYSVIFSDEQ